MDFIKLLQSLQDLMYELVVWVMLLPKTLTRAIFRPDLMVAYVNQEWKKPVEEQFDDYLAPVPFLLIGAILPAAAIKIISGFSIRWNTMMTENDLLFSAFVTVGTLIIFLAWLEWKNKRPLRRSGLKRLFYIQCYLVVPAQIIYALLVVFALNTMGIFSVALIGIFLPIFYESFAYKDELKVGWLKGFWYAAIPFLTLFLFLLILGLALLRYSSVNLNEILNLP